MNRKTLIYFWLAFVPYSWFLKQVFYTKVTVFGAVLFDWAATDHMRLLDTSRWSVQAEIYYQPEANTGF